MCTTYPPSAGAKKLKYKSIHCRFKQVYDFPAGRPHAHTYTERLGQCRQKLTYRMSFCGFGNTCILPEPVMAIENASGSCRAVTLIVCNFFFFFGRVWFCFYIWWVKLNLFLIHLHFGFFLTFLLLFFSTVWL